MCDNNVAPVSIFRHALLGAMGYDRGSSPNCKESVSEHCLSVLLFTAVICLYSNLYNYKASDDSESSVNIVFLQQTASFN